MCGRLGRPCVVISVQWLVKAVEIADTTQSMETNKSTQTVIAETGLFSYASRQSYFRCGFQKNR